MIPVVRPLERAGHQVIRLYTMTEAVNAMDTMYRADLILLDVALPPSDALSNSDEESALLPYTGLYLLHHLHQTPDFKTPVVVLTDLRCPQLKRALQVYDVADIVYMPIRPSELHRRLDVIP